MSDRLLDANDTIYVVDLVMAITRHDTSAEEKITTTIVEKHMSFEVPRTPPSEEVTAIKFHVNVHDAPDSEDKFKLEIELSRPLAASNLCTCGCGCGADNKVIIVIVPELRDIAILWRHQVVQTACGSDTYAIASMNIYIQKENGHLVLFGRLHVGAGQKSVTSYM